MQFQHQNLKSKYKSHLLSNRFSAVFRSQRHVSWTTTPAPQNKTQLEYRKGQWINLRSWIVVDKCTKKKNTCNITVASKRYATRKKLNPNMPLKIHNGTSLASRCPHVLSYAPTYRAPYRRHLLPSTGDKTNCSINNIIQSGQTTRLTL